MPSLSSFAIVSNLAMNDIEFGRNLIVLFWLEKIYSKKITKESREIVYQDTIEKIKEKIHNSIVSSIDLDAPMREDKNFTPSDLREEDVFFKRIMDFD